MHIDYLSIENLRNIKFAELSPNRNINIVVGKNGAGKTSILESIYLLARARSFRQKTRGRLINEKADKLNLFARLETSDNTKHKIGLEQRSNQITIRKDGENLQKLSFLAKALPLTIITPNIQRVVEEEPEHRRRMINWGMFHVEHGYGDLVRNYKKALLQRNNALRGSRDQIKVWDGQIIDLGSAIHQRMLAYTSQWNESLSQMVDSLDMIKPITLELKKGWKENLTFSEALERNLKLDQERGFSSCGPHRSDIRILQNGVSVKHQFSRGEAKIVAVLMLLSQTRITQLSTGESPVLLVDDLHSELDSERYEKIVSLIYGQGLQSFITTLNRGNLENIPDAGDCTMFHVEHGCLKMN
ncbi:MAG: DNA replication/repair protein RecF [Candidatus Thiodiazotropha sp.]